MWQKIKNIYHLLMAFFANIYFGFPSRKITVIGVTGTDGKTTTVSLIYQILNDCGYNISMISSVEAKINEKSYETGFHVTTPSSWMIQKFFRKALEINKTRKKYMVLEVTSHAIDQYRIWGINFEIALLTNVTEEHLDYHKTHANYVTTKLKLLQKAKYAITNKDDRSYQIINSGFNRQSSELSTYGFNQNANVNLNNFKFKTKLAGDFNKYNILAAVAVAKKIGVQDFKIRKTIENFNLPCGRLELVHDGEFTVIVDFAHTPNAIKQVLKSFKTEVKGKLIHVFGSAGERDRKKRPQMGKISSEYADVIIVTTEDSRSELAENIANEIVSGIQNSEFRIQNETLLKITDRQEAINKAIKMAKKRDLILITGKGHEKSINLGKGEVPWSDQESVRKALNN